MHTFLTDQPKIIRLIKDIALNHLSVPHVLVFLSHRLQLPPEIARYGAAFRISLPSDEGIMAIVREEARRWRSEEHTSELQSRGHLVCRLLLEKKNRNICRRINHILYIY